MPQQNRQVAENKPVSFRPGALQRDRLNQLMKYRQQNQSVVINIAIDLLYLFDLGFDQLEQMRQADLLTSYGRNDPTEGE